uniref:Fcf2 pre-rRNA processing C-terminal domain-containing protein n=1 Tax=Trichuris muris TaxID=70415 RepID=A0A5S6Q6L5_TRIMR
MSNDVAPRNEFDESDEEDSDAELQLAFAKGLLKPGLNVEVPAQETPINNENALAAKLQELKRALPWIERMSVNSRRDDPSAKDDDFQLEISFNEQAKRSVLTVWKKMSVLPQLRFRPADYFSEMVKTDEHMLKIREKQLNYFNAKVRANASKGQLKRGSKAKKNKVRQRKKKGGAKAVKRSTSKATS